MRKVKFYLSTGIVGGDREKIVEYPDEITEDEIDEDFDAWVADFDMGWYTIK